MDIERKTGVESTMTWDDDERGDHIPLEDWCRSRGMGGTAGEGGRANGGCLGPEIMRGISASLSQTMQDVTRAVDYQFYLPPSVRARLGWCHSKGEDDGESLGDCWRKARDAAAPTPAPTPTPTASVEAPADVASDTMDGCGAVVASGTRV